MQILIKIYDRLYCIVCMFAKQWSFDDAVVRPVLVAMFLFKHASISVMSDAIVDDLTTVPQHIEIIPSFLHTSLPPPKEVIVNKYHSYKNITDIK